ncbi:MAG: hypothetical protein HN390_04510 [Anaerolineae bacterium]|nr:hypothetical protein [Anaerolineae bacterium]MBT7990750.1 hypothetical protein [Anaerolineae bacterium]
MIFSRLGVRRTNFDKEMLIDKHFPIEEKIPIVLVRRTLLSRSTTSSPFDCALYRLLRSGTGQLFITKLFS